MKYLLVTPYWASNFYNELFFTKILGRKIKSTIMFELNVFSCFFEFKILKEHIICLFFHCSIYWVCNFYNQRILLKKMKKRLWIKKLVIVLKSSNVFFHPTNFLQGELPHSFKKVPKITNICQIEFYQLSRSTNLVNPSSRATTWKTLNTRKDHVCNGKTLTPLPDSGKLLLKHY